METLLVLVAGATAIWIGVLSGALVLRLVLDGTRRALGRARRS